MDNFTNGTLDVAHLLACEEVTSKVVLQHQPLDLLQRRQRNVGITEIIKCCVVLRKIVKRCRSIENDHAK